MHIYMKVFKDLSKEHDSNYSFDDTIFRTRKGLLFLSFIIFIATGLVEKGKSSIEINIGIVKGSLSPDWYIYYVVGVLSLYFLSWHILHARKISGKLASGGSYSMTQFVFSLARIRSNEEMLQALGRDISNRWMHPSMADNSYSCRAEFRTTIDSESLSEDEIIMLKEHPFFEIDRNVNCVFVTYKNMLTKEDFIAWKSSRDIWSRHKLADWMIVDFPIYVFFLSIANWLIFRGFLIN